MSGNSDSRYKLFHLQELESTESLDRALKSKLEGWTWGQVREAILRRRIQVNGNLCLDASRKVSARDVIKVWNESLPKPIEASDIRLAYVDDFLVVVEKPPGVTSTRHFEERNLPTKRRQLQMTLEELMPWALMLHHEKSTPSSSPAMKSTSIRLPKNAEERRLVDAKLKRFQVIAVHRLDRDTSGLMIFSRTPSIAQSLGKMFKLHQVERRYHAVVLGAPKAQTFDSVLVRDRGDGHRGSKPNDREQDPSAQRAVTHIRPIERIGDYSIIECRLETGRTHQIRIHLAEAGHMLCGDSIYDQTIDGIKMLDRSGAPRQALHSATLSFAHPISGTQIELKMSWPPDLFQWLKRLRLETKASS